MKIENIKEQQRELFEQFGRGETPKKPSKIFGREKRFLLSVSLDMLLLYFILSLMVALLLYAAGVEIGRRHQRIVPVVEKGQTAPIVQPEIAPPVVSIPLPRSKEAPKPKQAQLARPPVSEPKKQKPVPQQPVPGAPYTIQVASYRQSGPAGKAVETLKKRGIPPFF